MLVDGVEVWHGRSETEGIISSDIVDGEIRDLTGISATLSGQSARVQLWEDDPGAFNSPKDGPAELFADYTGGDERRRTLNLNGGVYEITYMVDLDIETDNIAHTISNVRPVQRARVKDREEEA